APIQAGFLFVPDVIDRWYATSVGTPPADQSVLGITGPSLRQGAAGRMYFEPGGVSFGDWRHTRRRLSAAIRRRSRNLIDRHQLRSADWSSTESTQSAAR